MASLSFPSRRTLLTAAALGAGALAARTTSAQDATCDVVVVGAGAAGIAAGIALKNADLNCKIVEAENRIGGRAFTDSKTFSTKGHPVNFDIGCAWIHAYHKDDPFAAWSEKLHYDTQAHGLEVNEIYYGNTPYSSLMVEFVHARENDAYCGMKNAGGDVAASSVIKDWQRPMDAAATYMGPMDMGVDFDELSSSDFVGMANYEPNYLVREGYGTLVRQVGMEAGLDISTGVRVTAIDRSGPRVKVITANHGTLKAKAAIVTVSNGVLGADAIKFTPKLPDDLRQAIDDVPMGLLAKIPLQIPGLSHYVAGIKPYDNAIEEYSGAKDIYFLAWPWNLDLMVGFVGGKFGWDLCREGQQAALAFAKERLRDLFGADVSRKVRAGLLTPWATNEFTRGAYSAARPGKHASREKLAMPVDDKIFLAGEALAPCGMYATCSGAYMSGTIVANKVVTALTGKVVPGGDGYDKCEGYAPPKDDCSGK